MECGGQTESLCRFAQSSGEELQQILETFSGGDGILELINRGLPNIPFKYEADEFLSAPLPTIEHSHTWTLVLMTSLRKTGTTIQKGRLKHMLRSALPLTSDVSIVLNDEPLQPTKIDTEVQASWILGRNLHIENLTVSDLDSSGLDETVQIKSCDDGDRPFIEIEGIEGKVSGQVTLYASRISRGKSETSGLGASNGYFINILGRVINLDHPDFGLKNLSHGTWSQFRATFRADGLDRDISVEREGLRESRAVKIFKAFLMATFNKARMKLAEARTTEWPSAGDVLDGSWKNIPLKPLAEVVTERLSSGQGLPKSIEGPGSAEYAEVKRHWIQTVDANPGDMISAIRSEKFKEDFPFSKYVLQSRELLINELHPYFIARSGSVGERLVLQDFALANFLTELYWISHQVDSVTLDEGRDFRDAFLRLLAQLKRKTGTQIALMLEEVKSHADGLEVIVGDALDYVGFYVTPMAGNGEPEGIARAPMSPDVSEPARASYSFTYDAKSTEKENGRVTNAHVRASALARHREDNGADYSLVVAPDFQLGALQKECQSNKVTPLRTRDLAKLLVLSAASGDVDFVEFRKIFLLYDPDRVHDWVEDFICRSKAQEHISVMDLLTAFEEIGIERTDELVTDVVSYHLQNKWNSGGGFPNEAHIRSAVQGLNVFLPSIVRISNRQIYLSARPRDIRQALTAQLQLLPEELRHEFEPEFMESRSIGTL